MLHFVNKHSTKILKFPKNFQLLFCFDHNNFTIHLLIKLGIFGVLLSLMMSYGPQLPPNMQKPRVDSSDEDEDDDQMFGPKLPGEHKWTLLKRIGLTQIWLFFV